MSSTPGSSSTRRMRVGTFQVLSRRLHPTRRGGGIMSGMGRVDRVAWWAGLAGTVALCAFALATARWLEAAALVAVAVPLAVPGLRMRRSWLAAQSAAGRREHEKNQHERLLERLPPGGGTLDRGGGGEVAHPPARPPPRAPEP